MEQNFCPYCMSPVRNDEPCSVCGLTKGSYTPAPHHLPPNTILKERYLIGRVLGEGGFGITYIGCDLQLEVKVAVKEYFPVNKVSRISENSLSVTCYAGTAGEGYDRDLDRFLKEARTMAKLSKSPTIVSVHDFFQANGTAYIVMEYIDGTTFKDLVKQRGGKIPAWELLHLIEPLFFALQTMHDAGLIHRDISPENIMLENGVVRLLDFGCAREVDGDKTLTVSLKHSYAPVEQYQGKGQGPWTDVYALAATIYYCLTGIKPPQAMDRLVEDELILPRKVGVDLTEKQEKALLKGMNVRPRQRCQSMTQFHAALYEGVETMPNTPVMTTVGMTDAFDAEILDKSEQIQTGTQNTAAAGAQSETDSGTAEHTQPTSDTAGTTGTTGGGSIDDGIKESSGSLSTWIKKNPLFAGIGAAVIAVLVVVIIAVSVTKSGSTGEETALPVTVDTEETESLVTEDNTEGTTVDYETADYEIIGGVAYVTNEDGDDDSSLLAALDDDGADSVVVSGSGWIYTTETLEIHKPLTLESGIYASDPVIIGEGGSVTVDNPDYDLCICGLLRTMDGGTITVTSSGTVTDESGILWLESFDDLTVESGAAFSVGMGHTYGNTVNAYNSSWYFNVIDEDALFADAVPVTTEEELREAAEDAAAGSVTAITITEDITLTESFYQSCPVRIAEGVTVVALGEDQELDEDGDIVYISGDVRENNYSWYVGSESVLINHGTLKGDFFSEGEEDDLSTAWVINDGTIDVSGVLSGMFINLEEGTCNIMHGTLDQGGVVNLGTFTHIPRLSEGLTYLNIRSYFYNSGTLLIEGTEDYFSSAQLTTGEIKISASGIIEIGGDAELLNTTSIENQGRILLSSDSASFCNAGVLDMNNGYAGSLDVSDGSFENTGIVKYTMNTYPYTSDDANAFTPDESVSVGTASELQAALEDESVGRITIEDDIFWEGDLLISGKDVWTWKTLNVSGGDLTVEDGVLYCSGEINLGGGTLTAEGLGVVYAGSLTDCSGINIQASSTVILADNELYDMEINLNVDDGENGDARLIALYGLNLTGCTVTLATSDSYICCFGEPTLNDSTVNQNDGQIITYE